jgi:hypothetical protein
MKCFFYSHCLENPHQRGPGVVSFVIPDLNITFRAKYMGTQMECYYAALLALLEFADLNPQLFREKILQVYSDNFRLVNQVNLSLNCGKDLEPLLNMALQYKKKVPYSIGWISPQENPAIDPTLLE